MIILILFAFPAGIVTILSPCILPVLPIVLSGSIGGDKRKPLGIVVGFIASFTFFTLFLSTLVRTTGVSADALRTISVFIILGFGLSLLISKFQLFLEKLFARLSQIVPHQSQNSGFLGGILLGFSIGLLWTPCVGPILAAVITLAATNSVTAGAVFITLAYSLGTAIPMLAITYGGRQLLQKVPWVLTNSAHIQKAFGVIMILVAVGIFFNFDRKFQAYILGIFPQYGVGLTKFEDNKFIQNALKSLQKEPLDQTKKGKPMFEFQSDDLWVAPEFIPGGQWFNLPASEVDNQSLTLANLKGSVVLVDFWTYTCINCIRTLPYLKSWHEKYKDKGLVIVGVHTPEFEFEKLSKNVEQAIADFGIKYPVMQDNDYATWKAYNNRYWPAKYFIDKSGKIRWQHFGEGAYDESEKMIQQLLAETGQTIDEAIDNPKYRIESQTPELYIGSNRYADGYMDFTGQFVDTGDYKRPAKNSTLTLNFTARDVYLVMRPKTNQIGYIRVYLDNQVVKEMGGEDVKEGVVTVDADRLYKLIHLSSAGSHILKLEFLDDKIELYAFTFG